MNVEHLVELVIVSVVGFGLALYIGYTFAGAIPGAGGTEVNSILSSISTDITTIFVPIIAVVFVLFLYSYVKSSGLLGHKNKG